MKSASATGLSREIQNQEIGTTSSRGMENLVLQALSGMKKGLLEMSLPDGAVRRFGEGRPKRPARIHVRDREFFRRCALYGDVGFGEAFVEGLWDTEDIGGVIAWFLLNLDQAPTVSGASRKMPWLNLLSILNRVAHLGRHNNRDNARKNIYAHYDLGNEFFGLFLDPGMTYSSALYEGQERTLEAAQEAKYEALCQALHLRPGDRVLEIGCGWGGFAEHAVKRHGVTVVGVTISSAQREYALKRIHAAGLSDRVSILLSDYRDLSGRFDKIASIEMLEAVGHRYLPDFFRQCARLLKPDGLVALQIITCPDSRYDGLRKGVDFIQKHIFPGSLLNSLSWINQLVQKHGFSMHELRDMGFDYSQTLKAWRENFMARLDEVREQGFDEAFIRKWRYYFEYCEAAFAMRNISVCQVVYTRPNNTHLNPISDRTWRVS